MRVKLLSGLFCVMAFFSCKKEEVSPVPEVSFGVQAPQNRVDTSAVIEYPTWVNLFFVNNSEEDGVYAWDFGNGQTSEHFQPGTIYKSSGDYTVTLTVTKNGQTNKQEKTVRVVDRYIDAVMVNALNWNTSFHTNLNWPDNKAADVFFRVYKWDGPGFPSISGEQYQNVELLYESAPRIGARPSDGPFVLNITKRDLIIQHPSSSQAKYGYCLYARDQGQEYLLLSNWGFGVSNPFFDDYISKQCYQDLGFVATQFRITGTFGGR